MEHPFEVKQGTQFLADFKPYGREGFIWQLTDHLGQVRVIFDDNGNKVEDYDYYPFGMRHLYWEEVDQDRNRTGVVEQSGILQNIDMYSFRAYDRSLGRFMEVDPISSQFPHVNVYNYAENEPVAHIDLWGLQQAKPQLEVEGKIDDFEFSTEGVHFNGQLILQYTQEKCKQNCDE